MSALPRGVTAGGDGSADPLGGTIADYQAGRRKGTWTAEDVTKRALERCRGRGAKLRAIDVLSATAVDEARASDARARAGTLRGPLDGVPVFAKSIYDVKGLPTTGSSAEWARLFPAAVRRDALEVARLRVAGAVILGKTAADDFAFYGNGTSSYTGQVLNPYDRTRTRSPGGSSAGSAVAVATGMAGLVVARSIPAQRVIAALEAIFLVRPAPRVIVCDNGPEFTSLAMDQWAHARGITLDFIRPGRPVENCFIESFNGKFRDECLNAHHFADIPHAQQITHAWHADYHTERPHHSLGQRTPAEFAALFTPEEPYSSRLTLRS